VSIFRGLRCFLALSALLAPASAAFAIVDVSVTVDADKLSDRTLDDLARDAAAIDFEIFPTETIREAAVRQCVRTTPAYFAFLRARFFELNPKVSVLGEQDILDSRITNRERYLGPFCPKLRFGAKKAKAPRANEIWPTMSGTPVRGVGRSWTMTSDNNKWAYHGFNTDQSFAYPYNYQSTGKFGGNNYSIMAMDPNSAELYATMRGIRGLGAVGAEDSTHREMQFGEAPKGPDDVEPIDNPNALRITFSLPKNIVDGTIASVRTASLDASPIEKVDEDERGRLVVHESITNNKCVQPNALPDPMVSEFDPARIINALALNVVLRLRLDHNRQRRTTYVYVADSGLQLDGQIPLLKQSTAGPPSMPKADYAYRTHGTEVSALVLGGANLTLINNVLLNNAGNVRVHSFDIVIRKRNSNGKYSYSVDGHRLQEAVKQADRRSAIINLSVRFPNADKMPSIQTYMDRKQALIVVAAGNSGQPLNNHAAYPAKFGGDDNNAIITVAGTERNGDIAPFSNHGAEFVDIAALGCNVRSWSYETFDDGSAGQVKTRFIHKELNGTSFATPMVSATAAWLQGEYSGFDAVTLKQHIISSADIHDGLSEHVKHGRILNAYKAIRSVFADVVELEDDSGKRRLLTGRLLYPGDVSKWKIGGQVFDRALLRKIARYKPTGSQSYIIYRTREVGESKPLGDRKFASFLFGHSKFQFEDAITGKKNEYDVSKIRDIVFARRPYWKSSAN
jgi:subtilase family protein